jgi:iron complex transport system ATP-binding protein
MLTVSDVQFSYHKEPLFADVSFNVKPGILCALFGPNGTGKSTLLKCCMNLLHFSKGLVKINGRNIADISTAALAREVAFVPQDHVPSFPFLVEEVIIMGRAPHFGGVFGISEKDRAIVHTVMENFNITNLSRKPYTQLSGGQRQLTLIARAIAQDTRLIMLDEPTASLDFKNQILIWETLRRIANSGKTIFVCAHDPNHVSWFCDEVIVLHQKTIRAQGVPRKILSQNLLTELYGEGVCRTDTVNDVPIIFPATSAWDTKK